MNQLAQPVNVRDRRTVCRKPRWKSCTHSVEEAPRPDPFSIASHDLQTTGISPATVQRVLEVSLAYLRSCLGFRFDA